MRPPVAAMMQEMITIGVILASNSTPDGADTENPPAGILASSLRITTSPMKLSPGMEAPAAGVGIHTQPLADEAGAEGDDRKAPVLSRFI
jgi:hypothetical protein